MAARSHRREEALEARGRIPSTRAARCLKNMALWEEDGFGGAELQDSCRNQPSTRRRNRHQDPKTITQKTETALVLLHL